MPVIHIVLGAVLGRFIRIDRVGESRRQSGVRRSMIVALLGLRWQFRRCRPSMPPGRRAISIVEL